MDKLDVEFLRLQGLSCISKRPLRDSSKANLVVLDYEPDWPFPFVGNVLVPDQPRRAIAIVHDQEMSPGRWYEMPGKCKYAIEIKGREIFYHPVSTLKSIRYEEKE